ncbi:MAG TPA: SulP family inorganic anion transporter [Gammaproteobacteria bacterium]|nr:SulP family inorganic anion transporter [Gammaproteobacteria bacterium]
MIAIREAYAAGLLAPRHWLRNLLAGAVVGVVALPLAMAFAIASGARPEQGLYTALVAGACVSLFGGSRVQIAGPTGAFIVILAGITAKYGIDGLQTATVMAGAILVFFGIARLGGIIKYIPDPVVLGFTAGIGVIIFVGQWSAFLGLPAGAGTGAHFHEKLWHLLQALPQLHPATAMLALTSLLLVIATPLIPGLKRVPGPLTAMLAATVAQRIFHFEGVATLGSTFGGIPRGLPPLHLPELGLGRMLELIGPAFTIAMLGAIESLLSAVVSDGMAGTKHDSNQELLGQGLANILAPLFGGFAATGAIARTATNIKSGGNGPLAGVVHSVTLVLILLCLAPLAVDVPICALAAILFVVAWNMSEVRHFMHMLRRAPRADVAILLATFLLTVFADLVVAVNIGVILATLHFMRRMAKSVEVQKLASGDLAQELKEQGLTQLPPGVLVYAIDGPFFFGAVENFEQVLNQAHLDPKLLIIRLKRVPFMDITGLQALEEAVENLKRRGVSVMLSEANPRVHRKLERAGILALLGKRRYFHDFASALKAGAAAG